MSIFNKLAIAVKTALAIKLKALEAPKFAGQHYADPARKQRREAVARLGRRQYLKAVKNERCISKAALAYLEARDA